MHVTLYSHKTACPPASLHVVTTRVTTCRHVVTTDPCYNVPAMRGLRLNQRNACTRPHALCFLATSTSCVRRKHPSNTRRFMKAMKAKRASREGAVSQTGCGQDRGTFVAPVVQPTGCTGRHALALQELDHKLALFTRRPLARRLRRAHNTARCRSTRA